MAYMITFNSQAMTIVTVCDDRENAMRSDKIKNIQQQPYFIFKNKLNYSHLLFKIVPTHPIAVLELVWIKPGKQLINSLF